MAATVLRPELNLDVSVVRGRPCGVVSERHQERQGQAALGLRGFAPSGLMIWRARHVVLVPETDLALLTLEYASALPDMFRLATITTRMPKIGEHISVVGLRAEAAEVGLSSKLNVIVARGKVTMRYPNRRDQVMLPGPCVEIESPAIGGMSGGPAFDDNGTPNRCTQHIPC